MIYLNQHEKSLSASAHKKSGDWGGKGPVFPGGEDKNEIIYFNQNEKSWSPAAHNTSVAWGVA